MSPPVSVVKCQSYDENVVLTGLRQAIDLIGGIETFVKRGNHVLLKPNLLSGKGPERAVTTHPFIVKGMIQIVREAGGIPFIGDSPGIESTVKVARKAGILQVADEMECPVLEFNHPISSPKRSGRIFKQFEIDQTVLEADVVINLPKWKTHGMMLLTLGVKNLFGCIPGTQKVLWHLKAGEDRRLFAQMLIDLYQIIQPPLTLLDGIVGMEGNGPGNGDPVSLGLILASRDPLSLDQIVCDLLGISRRSLLTNRVAFEQGLGKDQIEIVGETGVKIPRFKLPAASGLDLPGFLKGALKNALTSKPAFEEALCDHCDRCIRVCPPETLKRNRKGLTFNDKKCIRCFCCQEVCPSGAIAIRPGWALGLIGRIRKNERSI